MAVILKNPSHRLNVAGEEGRYKWRDEKVFKECLKAHGLMESQVAKVWRMYTDRAFILRHVVDVDKFGYVIDQSHMSAMALEMGMHGTVKGKTCAWHLSQLIVRAGCFLTWMDDKDELVQFASPLFQEGTLTLLDNQQPQK